MSVLSKQSSTQKRAAVALPTVQHLIRMRTISFQIESQRNLKIIMYKSSCQRIKAFTGKIIKKDEPNVILVLEYFVQKGIV